jgi:transposase
MNLTIAVDLAKSVFEIAVSRFPGRVCQRHRVARSRFHRFFAQRKAAVVLFEACSSAHFWARQLEELGHKVVLLPPHLVRRYRGDGKKTDRADAKALLEAFRNDEVMPVPVKTTHQQTLGALHRLRSRWMVTRVARINTLRGLLREFGLVIPVGARNVRPQVTAWVNDVDSSIPDGLRLMLSEACEELVGLEERIRSVERRLAALAKQVPGVARLRSVPGIGLLTATALVAFVGDATRFRSGRRFASYLGLTPREYSSGCIRRLGRISKRGDVYLRTLLIHGARAALVAAKRKERPCRLMVWALELERRRGHNVATVALANKLARVAWAVWCRDVNYESKPQEEHEALETNDEQR